MQFMNGSQGVAAQHLYALNKIQDGFVTWKCQALPAIVTR